MYEISLLSNFSVLIIFALSAWWIFERINLPGLLGMILVGIILGPYGFDFISPKILSVSKELKTAALIVILIRAGLGINKTILNRIGISSIKMGFIPGIFEGTVIIIAAHYIWNFSWAVAGILGFIIAAVSPAVVVPQMIDLKEKGFGKNKEIPTLILAGSSLDDIFAITIFSTFLSIALGRNTNLFGMILNPFISILLGIIFGVICGLILVKIFNKFKIRDTKKVLIFMTVAIFLHELENWIPIASLLGVMAIGFVILEKLNKTARKLSKKFNKVWVLAEIILFTLIGAQVNIGVILKSGLIGLFIIIIGLSARSLGVYLSLVGSNLNNKEKLFCGLSYIPKATVQAAIGAVPMEMGIKHGEVILAAAVLSIAITAPLGAILIRLTHKKLLKKD